MSAVLVGLSTAAGAFTEEIVREMAAQDRTADHLPALQSDNPRRGPSGRLDAGPTAGR